MDWDKLTFHQKVYFLEDYEGKIVYAHSEIFKFWGILRHFGSCWEISVGCNPAGGMDAKGSAVLFFRIPEAHVVIGDDGTLRITVKAYTMDV